MKDYALLSVTDKTGIVEFAKNLEEIGYTIISTGGTAKALTTGGVNVVEVADYTESGEILNGRVKTLHPKVHGAILFDRKNADHVSEVEQLGIEKISIVVINLYKFKENAIQGSLTREKAIEHIDIGGPCMLRASAKNWQHVLSISDPSDYRWIVEKLRQKTITKEDRLNLAGKAFTLTSKYDEMISIYMTDSPTKNIELLKESNLRYGENPHQNANLYSFSNQRYGFSDIKVLQGKELSYNNLVDLDAASGLLREFHAETAVTIVKHTNPCGTAIAQNGDSLKTVWEKALSGDPKSAFGGIVAINKEIDKEAAEALAAIFLECIIAPGYSPGALEVFSKKKNLRLILAPWVTLPPEKEDFFRSIQGGLLIQDRDSEVCKTENWQCPTNLKPSDSQEKDLLFAFKVASHVKSNTIVYAKDGMTITVGAGQMSRIDAAEFAAQKAKAEDKSLERAVLASDAFFPFRDCVDLAAKLGISAIVQPGGSIRDKESIEACDSHGLTMVFTGERHFRH